MYGKPKTAKRLYFDVIPKNVDEYHQQLRAYPGQDTAARLANPVWHIHGGQPPASDMVVSFAMLLNLASAANAQDKGVLWGFIRRYAPEARPETHPRLDAAAGHAVRYFEDFVRPAKRYRRPTPREAAALADLRDRLPRLGRAGGCRGAAEPGLRGRQRARLRAAERLVRGDLRGAARRRGRGRASAASSRVYGMPETIALIDAGAGRAAGGGRAGRRLRRRYRRRRPSSVSARRAGRSCARSRPTKSFAPSRLQWSPSRQLLAGHELALRIEPDRVDERDVAHARGGRGGREFVGRAR